jgi:hypothetical protein
VNAQSLQIELVAPQTKSIAPRRAIAFAGVMSTRDDLCENRIRPRTGPTPFFEVMLARANRSALCGCP